jgi:hypothetical protein
MDLAAWIDGDRSEIAKMRGGGGGKIIWETCLPREGC